MGAAVHGASLLEVAESVPREVTEETAVPEARLLSRGSLYRADVTARARVLGRVADSAAGDPRPDACRSVSPTIRLSPTISFRCVVALARSRGGGHPGTCTISR